MKQEKPKLLVYKFNTYWELTVRIQFSTQCVNLFLVSQVRVLISFGKRSRCETKLRWLFTRSCSKPFKDDEMFSIYTSSNNAMGEVEKGHFWNEGAY